LRKDAPRINAIGVVDEANTAIGMLRLVVRAVPDTDAMLARVQNDLFDIGADLSVPGEAGHRLRMNDAPVQRLEAEIAAMNASLPKLSSFVLPAGSPGAVHAHLARTIVRRAERAVARVAAEEALTPAVLRYLNRLSDHLFTLARVLNDAGAGDVLWVPGANLNVG
jgi:cob(I)alamin adenosyltransferase